MNKKQLKIVTGVAIAVLIVSIIPVFWIGQYLHPFSDDYVFGAARIQQASAKLRNVFVKALLWC